MGVHQGKGDIHNEGVQVSFLLDGPGVDREKAVFAGH